MNNNFLKARDEFIEGLGNIALSFNFNRLMGQLYALLYLSKKPLSLDDMVKIIKASKGNVSVNIRELEKLGAVKKVWIKGTRKDFYEAETDAGSILKDKIISGIKRRMSLSENLLNKVDKIIEDNKDVKDKDDFYKERIGKLKTYLQLSNLFIDNIEGIFKNIIR